MRESSSPDVTAGAQIRVRDEQWLVRSVHRTSTDGLKIEAVGSSELVRDQDAVFFDSLDAVEVMDPHATELVPDSSPGFRRSRLWLESLLRQSATPVTDTEIVAGHRGLADHMDYQLRPAHQALCNLQPRILIGDAVGLGKTLEIGITLTELIQRGRGERILVVTPRAVLEQFQHEMWTRYAIPLIRLDSEGIQRVRQQIPASRNPFSYYRRAIISIDTLKNPARYRHHLQHQHWDAVVIDECHNLVNTGTQNHELAKLLAAQTDALILASATPHNGDPKSFANLINLLDPTAIADRSNYQAGDIEHLYVRRHRNSGDVRLEVGHQWAQRQPPRIRQVPAKPAERAVLEELHQVWLHPPAGAAPITGAGSRLLPWTMLKAFLSSPQALRASIAARISRSGSRAEATERDALWRLDGLAEAAQQAGPSKLEALLEQLTDSDIGPDSSQRVVVFSERIDTLNWLRGELLKRMRLPESAVRLLHAQLPDAEVQQIVEDFSLGSSQIRVLLASDMASEGINLHRQCHRLVHYDLPWSFIRIQQRNGRIDRYLQHHSPQITALALTAQDADVDSDLRVVTKLLNKEHVANQALGDAGALLDDWSGEAEEKTVMDYLQRGEDLDQVVPEPEPAQLNPFAALMATGGEHANQPAVPTRRRRTLFDDDDNFLAEALEEVTDDSERLEVYRDPQRDLLTLIPPQDLVKRLEALPHSYLSDRQVLSKLQVTGQSSFAQERLQRARAGKDTLWPDVGYLAPIHPVLEWAATRALSRFGRDQAPVMAADVSEPVFLTQASWANHYGQAVLARWGAITGLPQQPQVHDLTETLQQSGLKERVSNPGRVDAWIQQLQPLVGAAVRAATQDLRRLREEQEDRLTERLESHRRHLQRWQQQALLVIDQVQASTRRRNDVRATADRTAELIDSLATTGNPFVRVVGVIVPKQAA